MRNKPYLLICPCQLVSCEKPCAMSQLTIKTITDLLGAEADNILNHVCKTVDKKQLHIPNPTFVDDVFLKTDRTIPVLRNLQSIFNHGRLAKTGYLSILPIDQGIEHSAGASFAPNPIYFDPENLFKLAMEGGCNGIATTLGILGSMAREYAHKIPLILKLNHNELLSYPNKYDQICFANVKQAWDLGAVAVGATIYFGSEESARQIQEIQEVFAMAHELGMFTILWCYLRNSEFKTSEADYHNSADLTGQANYLGATIEADIIKQKLPTNNGGYVMLNKKEPYGKVNKLMYESLSSKHPVDLVRYQVVHNYMGRIGLINSGGASGKNDLSDAVLTAVLNKRGGGMGLISGRKAFQKPMKEGIKLLHAVQDVYLNKEITVA